MVQVFCKVLVNIGKQGNMIIVNLTNLPAYIGMICLTKTTV